MNNFNTTMAALQQATNVKQNRNLKDEDKIILFTGILQALPPEATCANHMPVRKLVAEKIKEWRNVLSDRQGSDSGD